MEYKIKVDGINLEDIHILDKKENAINKLTEGQIVEGIVTGIKPYGAFVKINNDLSGLVHIEDISVARIKSPYERFKIGQKIKIMIKSIDRKTNRVILTYKELLRNVAG